MLDQILDTPDDSELGYCVLADLTYSDHYTDKTKFFLLCPESNAIDRDNFTEYMNEHTRDQYTSVKKRFLIRLLQGAACLIIEI